FPLRTWSQRPRTVRGLLMQKTLDDLREDLVPSVAANLSHRLAAVIGRQIEVAVLPGLGIFARTKPADAVHDARMIQATAEDERQHRRRRIGQRQWRSIHWRRSQRPIAEHAPVV